MPHEPAVADHYTHGRLLETIENGVRGLGKTTETVTIRDLGPVDEFHIGGRIASEHFLDQFGIREGDRLLDVGCGLGGGARFAADRYGAQVIGIDLTEEFVETGRALCAWVGLSDRVTLVQGSALAMPFEAASFDAAYMMHVGMNIADKGALMTEVARVLAPGAVFGIYDVMRTGAEPLTYPVPWAINDETCALVAPEIYRAALSASGFALEAECDRRDFALEFFTRMKAGIAENGPPPLGLHLLMGETRAQKVDNMIANLQAGRISPVEMIARKAA